MILFASFVLLTLDVYVVYYKHMYLYHLLILLFHNVNVYYIDDRCVVIRYTHTVIHGRYNQFNFHQVPPPPAKPP